MTNKKRILKGIESLEKEKREHEMKMKEEMAKNKDNPVLDYWEKELKAFDKEIKKKRKKLGK